MIENGQGNTSTIGTPRILQDSNFPDGIIRPRMLANSTTQKMGDLYYVNAQGIFQKLLIGSAATVLTSTAGVPTWGTLPTFPAGAIVGTTDSQTLTNKTISASSNTLTGVLQSTVVGFSQSVDSATFNATVTKVCHVQIVTTKTSSVIVQAGCDTYCATTNLSMEAFIKRDGTTKTTGPLAVNSTVSNLRVTVAPSFAESGLAAGTYNYELWMINNSDNTTMNVGAVWISVLAIG